MAGVPIGDQGSLITPVAGVADPGEENSRGHPAGVIDPGYSSTATRHLLLANDESMRKAPPAMPAHHDERFNSLGRFSLSTLLAFALLVAALLSVAPGLHERLHPETARTHLCIVALFASGHCESATAAPVSAAPNTVPILAPLPVPAAPSLSPAPFCSILEHAPPALA